MLSTKQFSEAYITNWHPIEFVKEKSRLIIIMDIGHRVKSINNPDVRVGIIKEVMLEYSSSKLLLEHALEV